MPGRLFLVGTPIGNLGDVTLRAVETLKSVTRVYAEDTRRTLVLLSHLGIQGKKLLSLHAHSSERAIRTAVEILSGGDDVALVTDAGMPSVSDPGSELVRACRAAAIEVVVIPGPSAVTTAVAASGLVDGGFAFLGFLPRKGSKRAEVLASIAESRIPTVLFESPHRMHETLVDLEKACGARSIAICRELTKKFEEVVVAPLDVVSRPDYRAEWMGEFTLVVSAEERGTQTVDDAIDLDERARALLARGLSVREATQELTRQMATSGVKVSKRDVYARVLLAAGSGEEE